MAKPFDKAYVQGTDAYFLLPPGQTTYTVHTSNPNAVVNVDAADLQLRGVSVAGSGGGGGGGGLPANPSFTSVTIGGAMTLTADSQGLYVNNGAAIFPTIPFPLDGALTWGTGQPSINTATGSVLNFQAAGGVTVNGAPLPSAGSTVTSIAGYDLTPTTTQGPFSTTSSSTGQVIIADVLRWPTLTPGTYSLQGSFILHIATTISFSSLYVEISWKNTTTTPIQGGVVFVGPASPTFYAAGISKSWGVTYTFPFMLPRITQTSGFALSMRVIGQLADNAADMSVDMQWPSTGDVAGPMMPALCPMVVASAGADTLASHFE